MVVFVGQKPPVPDALFQQTGNAGRRQRCRNAPRILADDFTYPVSGCFQERQQVGAFFRGQPFLCIWQADFGTFAYRGRVRICLYRVQM